MARNPRTTIALALPALLAAPAAAQHVDVGLRVEGGAIRTLEYDVAGYGAARRVFASDLGEAGVPWMTDEPGYDCAPATFLPGTRIGVRFAGSLLAWNGTAFEETSAEGAPVGERLRLSYLTLSATSGAGPAPGIDLAVQSNGAWHRHLVMEVLAAPGSDEPDAGVYAARLQLYSTDPLVAASQEYWIVLNGGMDEAWHDAAIKAATALLGPPACTGDLNADATVDGTDLAMLLGSWGTCAGCAADLDATGTVDGADLTQLLGNWGPCP